MKEYQLPVLLAIESIFLGKIKRKWRENDEKIQSLRAQSDYEVCDIWRESWYISEVDSLRQLRNQILKYLI